MSMCMYASSNKDVIILMDSVSTANEILYNQNESSIGFLYGNSMVPMVKSYRINWVEMEHV